MRKTMAKQGYAGRRKIRYLLLGAFILSGISGCVYDNTDDCPQGIDVRLYSKTPCHTDTVYPHLSGLKLCVFDRNDKLVLYQAAGDAGLAEHFRKRLEVENGLYSVVAWSGLDTQAFDLSFLKEKITAKNDLLFHIQRVAGQAASIDGRSVYYGESPVVFLPDPAEYGSVFESVAVNMQEITNRMAISIEGLPQADDYEVFIESANGSMRIDGSIAPDEIIRYGSAPVFSGGILEAEFTILKLATGYNNTLVVRDKRLDRDLYRGDLLGTLLLKNPEVNLACDHDFTIRFTAKDQCQCGTFMIMEIWVNNWLVHSYTTDL